jgi:membrane-bound lytic murein transglycosylase D
MKKEIRFVIIFLILSSTLFGYQSKNEDINQHQIKLYPKNEVINIDTSIHIDSNLKIQEISIFQTRLGLLKSSFNLDYNPFVQNYIDLFLKKRSAEMSSILTQYNYYLPIFEQALNAYQIPLEFKYLPIVESALNPVAVSRSGAAGLWQFMPSTGRVYGLKNDHYIDERLDPIASSYAAAAYLRDAYDELGDWQLALTAYNCGTGAVKRALESTGGNKDFWTIKDNLSAQAQNYLPFFIAVNYVMNYYPLHQEIKIIESPPIVVDSIYAKKYISLSDIQRRLNLSDGVLQSLNPVYKIGLVNGTIALPKRIIIPKISAQDYNNLFVLIEEEPEDLSLKEFVKSSPAKLVLQQGKAITHTVAQGQNLTQIANIYAVSVDDVGNWNNLTDYNLNIGQQLTIYKKDVKIPSKIASSKPNYITYKVKKGDTLSEIAERYEHATVQSIKALNGLKSNQLVAGKSLKINAE